MAAGSMTLAVKATKKSKNLNVKMGKLTLVPKKKGKKNKSRNPFPTIMNNVIMKYINDGPFNSTWVGGVSYYRIARFAPYGLYDMDVDNVFGNNQPLYFDQLCTTTGPYNSYRVKSYRMSFKVINTSDTPIIVYLADSKQFTGGISENDTPSEIQNYPGVRKLFLTGKGGSKSIGTISISGSRKGQQSTSTNDRDTAGNSAANPVDLGSIVTLMTMSADSAAAGTAVIESTVTAIADFFNIDAVQS